VDVAAISRLDGAPRVPLEQARLRARQDRGGLTCSELLRNIGIALGRNLSLRRLPIFGSAPVVTSSATKRSHQRSDREEGIYAFPSIQPVLSKPRR